MPATSPARVELLWIPLGAGTSVPVVRVNGLIYERIAAARDRRPPRDLYHAALEVAVDSARYVVEMTPAWGAAHVGRASVGGGPVGLRPLGRWRLFRYEVHCWRDGVIPDRSCAVGEPCVVSIDPVVARRILDLAPRIPAATWGRDEARAGEMWNSNSVVAWLLVRAGADLDGIAPPPGGSAPGWSAGIRIAHRSSTTVH